MRRSIAKVVSDRLRSHPRLKGFLMGAYFRGAYCLARPKSLLDKGRRHYLPAEPVAEPDGNCFFGYYDKCPWDATGRYLLYHLVAFGDRMGEPGEVATIGFADLKDGGRLQTLGTTPAWSWQQGAMLQWLGGVSEPLVIHNDFRDGRYVSVVRDLAGEIRRTFDRPVYALSKDAAQAVSLNFARLHHGSPGYGYVAETCENRQDLHPSDDGIWHLNLKDGTARRIISLEQLAGYRPRADFARSFHYVNHLQFNPAATRFVFLHRWFAVRGGRRIGREFTRMFTANTDGSDLYCLADHKMVSHFTWPDDTHLLAWASHPSRGNRYYLFEDRTENVAVVGDGILTEDGHPSYSPDGQWVVTDTYPDKARLRRLILFNVSDSRRIDIGRYNAPFRFNGSCRCDLHPRWSRDGRKVCFDSVHSGRRRIYVVDVSSAAEGPRAS